MRGGVKHAAVLIKILKQEQASRKATTNHDRISACSSPGFPSCAATFERHLHVSLQWHALTREEQAKYYELARKERQLHMQLYPTWSARDNYVRFYSSPSSAPCSIKKKSYDTIEAIVFMQP